MHLKNNLAMNISRRTLAALILWSFLREVPLQVHAAQCEKIVTFNDLIRIVNFGMSLNRGEICFQPFKVLKDTDKRLLLNRPISLFCHKILKSDECKIEGAGNHVTIAGGNAKVNITGFTFQGATQSALRVLPTSFLSHSLLDCDFFMNRASMTMWRGGAIKTEVGTTLAVSGCMFDRNQAAGGGAIFHRGNLLTVIKSAFKNNLAIAGAALAVEFSPGIELSECVFTSNRSTANNTGAIELFRSAFTLQDSLSGFGNYPCEGVYDRSKTICWKWISDTTTPFQLGQITVQSIGLSLSTGLKAKIIARSGEYVSLTSPERSSNASSLRFHENPDAAAVFPLKDGGWIYLSNAENEGGNGGVFALEFDSNGLIRNYVARLTGTTRNCSGGKTPWNTWVSCEEYKHGRCWQVDPTGVRDPSVTKLVEGEGHFEAMAYDIRDVDRPYFFVTEDHVRGAIRRFTPVCCSLGLSWNTIQVNGAIDYLEFTGKSTFRWTSSLEDGRISAQKYYRNVEGVTVDDGLLYFVAKEQKRIFRLNLDNGTYTFDSTNRTLLTGGGSFEAQPDQLIRAGDMIYFTEDGGISPGIFASDGNEYFTVFVAHDDKFVADETTGLAFSPDGTKMYVCIQEIGYMFEITREDGAPFPGNKASTLKLSRSINPM